MDWQQLLFYALPAVACAYIAWKLWRGKAKPTVTPYKVIRAPKPEVGGRKKRVCAILGGTGFVGSHVVDEFLNRGEYYVYMLGRKFRPKRTNPAADALIQVDMQDFDGLVKAFQGVDSVVDVAAAIPTTFTSVDDIWRINKQGLKNVVKAAQQAGVRNFVYISGLRVNRDVQDKHMKAFLDSLFWGEKYVTDSNGEEGMQTCAILPGNIIGLRSDFVESLISGKTTSFPMYDIPSSFIPVEYVARAVANAEQKLAAGCEDVAGQPLHLTGEIMSFKQFLSLPTWPHKFSPMSMWVMRLLARMNFVCAKLTGSAPLGADFTPAIVAFFDVQLAEEYSGFPATPEILDLGPPQSMEDCIRDLVRKYNAQP